ncbi:DNA polymerase III subunit chi [Paludibacterium paludis]|uniref:DNA polymerase III subunit chi n=1 Tax=Paludibacterium paludis TaxID=1225769 RepID=A0A918P3W7_9NEIS|nr:DNA polymerase III subunit chi [Paludibacterium paludis]GGY19179.1 DNA polymerase III subunit chi [Paludibacterium paludis]
MTRIDFYTQVAEPHDFACRLVRRVYREGVGLAVLLADDRELIAFSNRLWSFEDTSFIPHCRASAPEADDTPIWLATNLAATIKHPVLLNLGPELPDEPGRFERILEIVGRDEASLARARERFRACRQLGFEIVHHDMSHK